MDAVTTVALPMFALIASGWVARRLAWLEDVSIRGLNGFVYFFALPALLFVRVAVTPITALLDGRLVVAWLGASLTVFVLTIIASALVFRHRVAVLGVRAMAATFGNIGYMGFPLVLTAFGREATLPAVLIFVTDVVVVVSLAIAIIEAGLGHGARWRLVTLTIARGLAQNPVILASVAGALVGMAALRLPAPVRAFGELLGGAALPCALFALGASLVGRAVASHLASVVMLVAAKLLLHPVLAWVLTTHVFRLDPTWARVAVIEAALPTAVTVFVFAERYNQHVEETSSAVLLSTVASVVTVSLLLATLGTK
jgi:malonate transporter and related proteins